MKKIEVTNQEIWAATRPSVQKSKKKYNRKGKAKKDAENPMKYESEQQVVCVISIAPQFFQFSFFAEI